ncbi:putative hydrocarbon binding protein [Symbiobacterium terraclitae]|uniref:Hydrocarbon binding protein n=1 Tax=Symbiobacterium terraclitae TaxID=557451 RepID=A0ABS4JNZ7_9FIRM|nr:V4R domain-containing protein [Symbiobacterium terraclitae]MBP2017263.1 putative hydrocarbon binding protein [Symbiobacterium terraclitae]
MDKVRPVLGDAVSSEAFQLFRLLGFDSLTEALGIEGEEQDQVQYMAGLSMGRALVRRGRIAAGSLDDVMASFAEFYYRLGMGLVRHAAGEDGAVTVSIAECVGCHGAEPEGRPICFVEAGLISGVLSEGLGVEFGAQERSCIGGKGDEVCEFILTRVSG